MVAVAVVVVAAAIDERIHHQENGHWLVEHNLGSPDDQTTQFP